MKFYLLIIALLTNLSFIPSYLDAYNKNAKSKKTFGRDCYFLSQYYDYDWILVDAEGFAGVCKNEQRYYINKKMETFYEGEL